MLELTSQRTRANARLSYGAVVDNNGGLLSIQTEEGIQPARRAASCLVDPNIDDVVLAVARPRGEAYVVAVLETSEPCRLQWDGDLTLAVSQGKFRLLARDGIELVTTKSLFATAADLGLRAHSASLFCNHLSFLSRTLDAQLERVKAAASVVDGVLDRISLRVGRSYRRVEELDQLRAERIDYRAESSLSLRSESASWTAAGLMRLDGEQIHLG